MRKLLADYFGFNRQQRNGVLVLAGISFTLLVIRIVYPHFITPAAIEIKNLPLVERKVDSAYQAASPVFSKRSAPAAMQKLFAFDPNTVPAEQLLALGFSERTVKTLLKFRSKGFVFKEKKDLQRIYGVSDRLYTSLEPYIVIEQHIAAEKEPERPIAKQAQTTTATKPVQIIDLNHCDSTALTSLNGIGPSYARRIIKYRELLGGFCTINQLKEVYGFPEDLFEKIKPNVTVTTVPLNTINLNKDEFKTINRHPYLGYQRTKLIFDWRKKTTITATNLKEILNDEALYRKLLPYLKFD